MAWLTYEEYVAFGGTASQAEFAPLELKARKRIDYRTLERIKTPDDDIKRLVYELIGLEQKFDERDCNLSGYGNDGESIDEYKRAFDYYYKMGRTGMSISDIRKNDNLFGNYLTAEAQARIANAGLQDREFKSGLTDMSVAEKSKQYKFEAKVLQYVGEKHGVEFIVLDESGKLNAQYLTGTNRVTLFRDEKGGIVLPAAGHETYHFIKDQATDDTAKAEVEALQNYVLEALKENGVDVEAEIARRGEIRDEDTGEIIYATREDCIDELVADSMFDVFTNEKFVENMMKENGSIIEKIAGKVKEILTTIKSAIKMLGISNTEIGALVNDVEKLEHINTTFNSLLEKVGEKYKAEHGAGSKNNTAEAVKSSGIKFSAKSKYPYDMQTVISEYIDSVDDEMLAFAQKYYKNPKAEFDRLNISNVNTRQANDFKNLFNEDFSNYKNAINKNAVVHIADRHGKNGTHDNSMSDVNDLARIEYVISNYDSIDFVYKNNGEFETSTEFRDKYDNPSKLIRLSKKINGTYYVVEAVAENKHKKIWVISAYIQKNEAVTQAPIANATGNTSETPLASPASNDIISGEAESVKKKFSHRQTSPAQKQIEILYENRNLKQIISLIDELHYSTVTSNVRLKTKDINLVAKKVLKKLQSKYDVNTLTDELAAVYNYLENSESENKAEEVRKALSDLAIKILEKSEMKDTTLYDQYKPVRDFLHEQRVYIPSEFKKEIEHRFGDFKSFRNILMGKMMHITTTDETAPTLDEVWTELAEMAQVVETLSDEAAVIVPDLFPAWDSNRGYKAGERFIYNGNLYRCKADNPVNPTWTPDVTHDYYEPVAKPTEAGTLTSPITAVAGMEYEVGKYYSEGGKVYLCEREGMSAGDKITLHYLPSALVGQYFREVAA